MAAALMFLPTGVARAATSGNESTMAREIADDINRERAARGLPSIPLDSGYSAGAQRVAESNRDRPCHACHSTDHPSGEVVWWGSDHPSSGSPIWWMGSPPHRALVLASNATKLGVGVACKGTEHDAVAWIETQSEAQNASPTPVATKSGAGSRCKGEASTPATTPGATTTVTRAAAQRAGTTTTAAAAASAKSPAATTTTRRVTGRSGSSTAGGGTVAAAAAAVSAADTGTPFDAVQTASGRPIAAASVSRPLARSRDVGATGTMLLLMTFVGALLLARTSRSRFTRS